MPTDLCSFIRFTAQADGRSTIGLGGVTQEAASPEFLLNGTNPVGRFFAKVKEVFLGPSESESRAAQAFIQAICQEYGSEGIVALKRVGVDEYKPIRSFQVQQIARTLDANLSNPELNGFREIPPLEKGSLNRHGAQAPQQETPISRSIRSAMALLSGRASMLLDDLTISGRTSPKRKLAYAVAVAVVSESPRKLMAIAEFKAQYQKRLNLAYTPSQLNSSNEQNSQFNQEAQVTRVVARLIEDILGQEKNF